MPYNTSTSLSAQRYTNQNSTPNIRGIDRLPLAVSRSHDIMVKLSSKHNPDDRLYYTLGSTSIKNVRGEKIFTLENPILIPNMPNLALTGSIHTKLSKDKKTIKIKFTPSWHSTIAKFKSQADKILANPTKFIQDNKEILAIIVAEIISVGKNLLKDNEIKQLIELMYKKPEILLNILLNKKFIISAAISLAPAVINFIKSCRPITLETYSLDLQRQYKLIM